jgi:multiple sugar transport system permease protein
MLTMARALSKYQGFLYVLPALVFVGLFVLWPLCQLVYLSLTDTSLLGGGGFIGLANYERAFKDAAFWRALGFTLKYTVFITPILMGLGFALALLTAPNRPLRQITRGVIFLPVVIGLGSSSLLWFWLFDQQVGPFNQILVDLGILAERAVWFTKADMALTAVTISVTWKVIGFGMLLFVAGIQSIQGEVSEAALIDGANYWQRVWHIILPLSMRTILLTTLISVIGSMLAFEQFYIMTGGNPRGQTFTSVYWIYQNSFISFRLGYGAALSLILTLIVLVFSSIQVVLSNRSPQS